MLVGEAADDTRAHYRDGTVMKSRNMAIAGGAVAAIALLSSGVLNLRTGLPSSPTKPGASTADQDSPASGDREKNVYVDTVAPTVDPSAHGEPTRNNAVAPRPSVRMSIGSSPPNFEHMQKSREAAFAAEALDPAWRHQMFRELSASLAVIEQGVASAQIDCKSTTCRIELVSRDAESREERVSRLKVWFQEIRQLGFTKVDTGFSPDGITSLSYLSTRSVNVAAQLPAEYPPEVAESFRQALGDNEHQPIGLGGDAVPITWVGGAPDRPVQRK